MKQAFVIQIDIPSIKSYVFGTDPLNEVRGASARLDWLNREEMERVLRECATSAKVEKLYANGGSAQFLFRECDEIVADTACREMVRNLRQKTRDEVRAVYGIAPLADGASYRAAIRLAHFRMRCQREFGAGHRSTSTMPAIMECASASHLPASRRQHGPDGIKPMSEASFQKVEFGRQARTGPLWDGWMGHLQRFGPWPESQRWQELRCEGMTDIGEPVGLVYADGNAMGRIVQSLDAPETSRQFSSIVDESIREACHSGLSRVTATEIESVRGGDSAQLPADILLLGGDDLLVAVPADRALDFSLHVIGEFERLTQSKIAALQDDRVRGFFRERLEDRGFTISCGVAIARSTYPFYLLLDLVEELLKNAKRSGSYGGHGTTVEAHDPGRIDFHLVAGANSNDVERVRAETFLSLTDEPRTLRPLTCSQLESLRGAIQDLRQAGFPRSKLHRLRAASLTESATQAQREVRDIFARCGHGSEHSQRRALWNSIKRLCPKDHSYDFPWFRKERRRVLCVADIVDAYGLFREHEGGAR